MSSFNPDSSQVDTSSNLPDECRIFRTLYKHAETPKSSLPVLSAQKPWFSQGFSHIGEVPLTVCSAHASSVHGGMRRCISRHAPKIESFFESHFGRKTLEFCITSSRTRVIVSRGSGIRTRVRSRGRGLSLDPLIARLASA